MIFPRKFLLSSLLFLSATRAFAADSAVLTVIGSITPPACDVSFVGGGEVNYGNIPADTLNQDFDTELDPKSVNYTILCDAPTTLAMQFTDNRPESGSPGSFGLGKQGTANIGLYQLQITSTTGDSNPVDKLYRLRDTDGAWSSSAIGGVIPIREYSQSPVGTLIPGAYSNVSGVLEIQPIIHALNTLDQSTVIQLNGMTTMTLRYL